MANMFKPSSFISTALVVTAAAALLALAAPPASALDGSGDVVVAGGVS